MSTVRRSTENVLARKEEILAPPDPSQYTTLHRLVDDEMHRLVVSFGGGSVPGLCGNLAFARLLEELGLREKVSEVWGTSAGAAIGGAWASGTPALEIYDEVAKLNRPRPLDVAWLRLGVSLLMRPLGKALPDGLVKGRHFEVTTAQSLSAETFEDCPIPFRCIAVTDDGTFKRKVFRRGPLLPAILSSMAIPGMLIPRKRERGESTGYYDGGLVEKTPLISPIAEHNRHMGDRKLLLVATHFGTEARATPARGFPSRFLQSITALENLAWEFQLAEARGRANLLLVILNARIDDPSFFDFSRLEKNYLQAREAYLQSLQNGRIALTFGNR